MTPVCRLCGRLARGGAVRPGPSFGSVHRTCFIAWDREEEALELEFGRGLRLFDPIASATEAELLAAYDWADAA